MYFANKVTPTHFIDSKCHTNKLKSCRLLPLWWIYSIIFTALRITENSRISPLKAYIIYVQNNIIEAGLNGLSVNLSVCVRYGFVAATKLLEM